jgi:hypothetical protein
MALTAKSIVAALLAAGIADAPTRSGTITCVKTNGRKKN